MKRNIYILLLFLSTGVRSQTDQIPGLKVALTQERLDYVIKETMKSAMLGVDVNFTVQSDYMGNTNSLKKRMLPASYTEIQKIKKQFCNCPEDMNRYFEIGVLFNRMYKSDSARLYLTNALGICKDEQIKKPDDLTLKYTEANIYSQAGDYASGVALYEKILNDFPKDSVARMFLTIAYMGMGDTAGFTRMAREAYEQYPDELIYNFFYIVSKGYQYLFHTRILQDKNISIEKLTDLSLLKKLPVENNDSTVILDIWHALSVFNGYLKFAIVAQDSTTVTDELGYFKIGNDQELDKVIRYFQGRVKNKKNKNAFMHHRFIALAYFLKGEFSTCINHLQKSIDLFPKDKGDNGENNPAESYNNIAGSYFMLRDTLMVINVLEDKVAKKPKIDPDPKDYVTLGSLYLQVKNEKKASEYYKKALEINTNQVNAYVGLASIEFKNKKYTECMNYLNMAYAIDPNEPNLYYFMGAINLIHFKTAEAWQIYKELYNYYPQDEFLIKIMNEYYYP